MRKDTRITSLTLAALAAFCLGAPLYSQYSQQGGKLTPAAAAGFAQMGYSTAISADGSTFVAGGAGDDNQNGAAWVFNRAGGGWTQAGSKLVGSQSVGPAQQGVSAAISGDGNTVLIGGDNDNGGIGAAWVFVKTGAGWQQQGAKLLGTDAIGQALQGSSVALSYDGNTALIGGFGDNDYTGAAWVFTRSGGVWTEQAKLVGPGSPPSSQGWSVGLSSDGNTAIVGGYTDASFAGAVWIFGRANGSWSQQPGALTLSGTQGQANLGSAVAISGDGNTAAVGGSADNGSTGAVWMFTRTAAGWSQQGSKLVGGSALGTSIQGSALALSSDGNTLVVGGPGDNGDAGAAWVFSRANGAWTAKGPKLTGTGSVGAAAQGFAAAVSSNGGVVVTGGYDDNSGVGACWVFTLPSAPSLSIQVSQPSAFVQGLNGNFTVAVSNAPNASPTVGTIMVSENPPAAMTVTGISGNGWSCAGLTCSRADTLLPGASFPLLTVNAGAAIDAPQTVTNQTTVSGGGAPPAASSDRMSISPQTSVLKLALSHAGTFTQGQIGTYYVSVNNESGVGLNNIALSVTLPAGVTPTLATATWTCVSAVCATTGTFAPAMTTVALPVQVTSSASGNLVATATLTAGSSTVSASDTGIVLKPPTLSITKSHASPTAAGASVTYNIVVSNLAGAGSTTGQVSVTENPPSGLNIVGMSGSGWSCGGLVCSRVDPLAGGASYPPINASAVIAASATGTLTNQAIVSGGGAGTVAAGDPTTVSVTASSPPLPQPGIAMEHSGAFPQGLGAAGYRIVVTNPGAAAASSLTVALSPPSGIVLTSLGGADWNCKGTTCALKAPLGPGASSVVSAAFAVDWNAAASVTVSAVLSGGGLTAPVTAVDPTRILPITNLVFARQLYRDLLGREPDAGGLAFWQAVVGQGSVSHAQAVSTFLSGEEMKTTGLFVVKLYEAVLGRDPDYGGWAFWLSALRSGTSPQSLLGSFLNSPEFQLRFGSTGNADFVTLVYKNVLGRAPDSSGYAYWLQLLTSGALSQAAMMNSFIQGDEFDRNIRPRAYGNLCYLALLRRSADTSGLATVSAALTAGASLTDTVNGYITSAEYLNRLAQLPP